MGYSAFHQHSSLHLTALFCANDFSLESEGQGQSRQRRTQEAAGEPANINVSSAIGIAPYQAEEIVHFSSTNLETTKGCPSDLTAENALRMSSSLRAEGEVYVGQRAQPARMGRTVSHSGRRDDSGYFRRRSE